MKNEQGKIIHFELSCRKGVSITHGYNISNSFPAHFHATYTLGIIELGECEFTYRGERRTLHANDIYIIQPFEPHSCSSLGCSYHSYKVISLKLDSSYYFPDLAINHPDLLSKVREFHALAEYENVAARLASLYDEIVALLIASSTEIPPSLQDNKISSKIRLAKQLIENSCHREISLKEIADAACLSEYHFNRHFHKCYGLSPYTFYLVCKMKKSQQNLAKQRSVVAAAYDVGLFDQSHFTKLFKKHTGVTPGKYLRDNRRFQ